MKNSGIIVKLSDGRTVIVYDKQPLAKEKGKIILNLVDEKYNLVKSEDGNPKIIIKDIHIYNEEMQVATLIGYEQMDFIHQFQWYDKGELLDGYRPATIAGTIVMIEELYAQLCPFFEQKSDSRLTITFTGRKRTMIEEMNVPAIQALCEEMGVDTYSMVRAIIKFNMKNLRFE